MSGSGNVGIDVKAKNVFSKPLYAHSKNPPTGYARTGFCASPSADKGNHSIAATVTDAFLDFSASQGNDLRAQAQLKGGMKWCLCANRWKEALDAAGGKTGDARVPKVNLHATDLRALDVVSLADLKKFAADGEIESDITPDKNGRGPIREGQEISGHMGSKATEGALEGPLVSGSRGQN